jgi:hypothetical protein
MSILRAKSEITAGDSSINNQAGTINNYYNGISITDAKNLFDMLFETNFIKMNAAAASTDKEFAAEITEKVIDKLRVEPELLEQFAKPGMQDSLFNVQKAYAISEDRDLADMLVEMIIERAKVSDKNRQRAILDECLKITPKLSGDQMDLLTLIHFRNKVKFANLQNLVNLITKFEGHYTLINSIDVSQVDYDLEFMEALGLGTITLSEYPVFGSFMKVNYPAYFMKGFTIEELISLKLPFTEFFIACFHDSDKFQFSVEEKKDLIEKLRKVDCTEERINSIISFWDTRIMSEEEITSYMEQKIPDLKLFNSVYASTAMKSFMINPIGTALSLSNHQRRFNVKNDLSQWVK